jgi:hypothetical protein
LDHLWDELKQEKRVALLLLSRRVDDPGLLAARPASSSPHQVLFGDGHTHAIEINEVCDNQMSTTNANLLDDRADPIFSSSLNVRTVIRAGYEFLPRSLRQANLVTDGKHGFSPSTLTVFNQTAWPAPVRSSPSRLH